MVPNYKPEEEEDGLFHSFSGRLFYYFFDRAHNPKVLTL
jgi:hypothetical protein